MNSPINPRVTDRPASLSTVSQVEVSPTTQWFEARQTNARGLWSTDARKVFIEATDWDAAWDRAKAEIPSWSDGDRWFLDEDGRDRPETFSHCVQADDGTWTDVYAPASELVKLDPEDEREPAPFSLLPLA